MSIRSACGTPGRCSAKGRFNDAKCGPAFSLEGATLYQADTVARTIYAFTIRSRNFITDFVAFRVSMTSLLCAAKTS